MRTHSSGASRRRPPCRTVMSIIIHIKVYLSNQLGSATAIRLTEARRCHVNIVCNMPTGNPQRERLVQYALML